jgi:hypothetical protein
MWQEIIVGIVVAAAALHAARKYLPAASRLSTHCRAVACRRKSWRASSTPNRAAAAAAVPAAAAAIRLHRPRHHPTAAPPAASSRCTFSASFADSLKLDAGHVKAKKV